MGFPFPLGIPFPWSSLVCPSVGVGSLASRPDANKRVERWSRVDGASRLPQLQQQARSGDGVASRLITRRGSSTRQLPPLPSTQPPPRCQPYSAKRHRSAHFNHNRPAARTTSSCYSRPFFSVQFYTKVQF